MPTDVYTDPMIMTTRTMTIGRLARSLSLSKRNIQAWSRKGGQIVSSGPYHRGLYPELLINIMSANYQVRPRNWLPNVGHWRRIQQIGYSYHLVRSLVKWAHLMIHILGNIATKRCVYRISRVCQRPDGISVWFCQWHVCQWNQTHCNYLHLMWNWYMNIFIRSVSTMVLLTVSFIGNSQAICKQCLNTVCAACYSIQEHGPLLAIPITLHGHEEWLCCHCQPRLQPEFNLPTVYSTVPLKSTLFYCDLLHHPADKVSLSQLGIPIINV